MGAPGPKRQLLTPALFFDVPDDELRLQLRTEHLDAEELAVCQVRHAGETDRPIGAVKRLLYDGGELVWGAESEEEIRRLVQDTIAGYDLADGFPAYVDFPVHMSAPGNVKRYERLAAVVLLGSRLAIVETGPGGRYVVTPIEPDADKPT